MEITRRNFMKSGFALVSTSLVVPNFLTRLAAAPALTEGPSAFEDRVLVLLQLAGGNDGLNTVIPYADKLYRTHRPRIGIPAADVLALDDAIGLHPSLHAFKTRFDQQQLAIVQGVGYPVPDRSHFVGTDNFQTASPGPPQGTGWIGRVNDG